MTPIDAGSNLSALVHAQLDIVRRGNPGVAQAKPQTGSQSLRREVMPKKDQHGMEEAPSALLEPQVLQPLRSIDVHDPERHLKVFRIFMESVLRKAFGPRLQEGPGRAQLLDRVLRDMEQDEELRQTSRSVVEIQLFQADASKN